MSILTINTDKIKLISSKTLLYLIISITSILMVAPIIWALLISFMKESDIIAVPPRVIPQVWTLSNYVKLNQMAPFFRFFANSFLISTVCCVFIAFTCPMAGYILAKYKYKGLNLIFILILATSFVPIQTYIIPLYLTVKSWGWVNTYQGMVFPLIISTTGVFLLRQHIKTLPDSLIDSAHIDVCSEFIIFRKIIFPLSLPAVSAVVIVNWVYSWSQVFMWYLIMANQEKMFPMEIGLMYFQRRFITDYGGMMAAAILTCLPMLLFFIIFRTKIIEGIAYTGSKF